MISKILLPYRSGSCLLSNIVVLLTLGDVYTPAVSRGKPGYLQRLVYNSCYLNPRSDTSYL